MMTAPTSLQAFLLATANLGVLYATPSLSPLDERGLLTLVVSGQGVAEADPAVHTPDFD